MAEVESLVRVSSKILGLTENPDSLLEIITDEARQLLHCEISYITLIDEQTDELYLKASTGPLSELFKRTVRLSLNEGLAGWVFRKRKPAVCIHYASDPRRSQRYVAILCNEHIESLLALPLVIGNRPTGVLFICKLSKHRFSTKETRLASAFANLAAIGLQNCNLYSEIRHVSARLEVLNESLRRRKKVIERCSSTIHRQFVMAELEGGQRDIINTLARLVDNRVIVEDRYGQLVAVGFPEQKKDAGFLAGAAEMCVLSLTKAYPQVKDKVEMLAGKKRHVCIEIPWNGIKSNRLISPITAHNEILGYVSVLTDGRKLSTLDITATEYAASMLALDMTKRRSIFEAEQKAKGDFLGRLLNGDYVVEEQLLEQASCLGHNLVGPRRIMVMRFDSPCYSGATSSPDEPIGKSSFDRLFRMVHASVSAISAESITMLMKGDIVVIAVAQVGGSKLSQDSIDGQLPLAMLRAAKQANHELTSLVGIGCICRKPEEYKKSYHQAMKSLDVANWLGFRDRMVPIEELGVYGLLFTPDNHEKLSEFSRELLEPLLSYDHEHSTVLLKTLSTYFECGSSLQATASLLFIHENTVRQRLERAADLLNKPTIRDADAKLTLQLALKIWEAEQFRLYRLPYDAKSPSLQ